MNEKMQLINSVSRVEIANILGFSRQTLYNKIKKNDIEEIYEVALAIKNKNDDFIKKSNNIKLLNIELINKNNELLNKNNEINLLKEEIKRLKEKINNTEIKNIKKELDTVKLNYNGLLKRYNNQNKELIMLKIELNNLKEV